MKSYITAFCLLISCSSVFAQSPFIPSGAGQELQLSMRNEKHEGYSYSFSALYSTTFAGFGIGTDLFMGLGFRYGMENFESIDDDDKMRITYESLGAALFVQKAYPIMEKWTLGYSVGLDYMKSRGETLTSGMTQALHSRSEFDVYGVNSRFIVGRKLGKAALNLKIPLVDLRYHKGLEGRPVLNRDASLLEVEVGTLNMFHIQFLYTFR